MKETGYSWISDFEVEPGIYTGAVWSFDTMYVCMYVCRPQPPVERWVKRRCTLFASSSLGRPTYKLVSPLLLGHVMEK